MLAFVFRILLAALSGAVAYTSYEPLGWWTAGIIAASLFYFVLMPWPGSASRENPGRYPSRIPQATSHRSQRPSMAQGALFGFVHAMACYLLLLPWIGEFVGSPPYIALPWCVRYTQFLLVLAVSLLHVQPGVFWHSLFGIWLLNLLAAHFRLVGLPGYVLTGGRSPAH